MTGNRPEPAYYTCTTVDDESIDKAGIATFPQTHTQTAHTTCQHLLIKPVNVVFIFKKAIKPRKAATNRSRHCRIDQVKIPSHHSTSHHHPERPSHKTVQGILYPALPTGRQLGHHRMSGGHENGAVKEPAKQKRVSKPDPGIHRWDGHERQRQDNGPRGLLGIPLNPVPLGILGVM